MSDTILNKKPSKMEKIRAFFGERWMSKNSPHSEDKSFQPKNFFLDLSLLLIGATIAGICVVLTISVQNLGTGGATPSLGSLLDSNQAGPTQLAQDSDKKEISLPSSSIVLFDTAKKSTKRRTSVALATKLGIEPRGQGTLVRVRLLNKLEVLKDAPIFSQIIDYSLGKKLYGKTILGEATIRQGERKILASFSHVKVNSKNTLGISAQALSLDGSLGLPAARLKSFATRSALSGMKSTGGFLDRSHAAPNSLEGVLIGALLKGLGNEVQFEQERAQTLVLPQGHEFFVKLNSDFPQKL